MKLYLLTVVEPEGTPPPREVLDKIMADVHVVHAELKAKGSWVFAGGLHPPSTATVIRAPKQGEAIMTDGPFIEGKEHVGGFCIIKADDLDQALEWGKKMSRALTLPVEVRPFRHVID